MKSPLDTIGHLSKRFPFCIYYTLSEGMLVVVAVIDARRDPLWIPRRLG
jgi:hypothetical protein